MSQPTGDDYQLEVYIKSKFGHERGRGPRNTLSQAVAVFLEALKFPIDIPDRQEDDEPNYGFSDYVIAKTGENLFYWLTSNEISAQDNFKKSVVTIIPDGVPTSFPGSRLSKSELPGVVRVFADSAPAGRAMDVAQRLWSLFEADPAFEVRRKRYDGDTGLLISCDEPDLVVHRCFPADEPQIVESFENGIVRVSFRLLLSFSRVK